MSNNPTDLVFKGSKWHNFLFKGQDMDLTEGVRGGFNEWPDFVRETFSRCYSDRMERLDEVSSEHQWAEKAHQCADEIPEFKNLQKRCRGDELWSAIAAKGISSQVLGSLPKNDNRFKEREKLQRQVDGFEGLLKAGVPVEGELQEAQEAFQAIQGQIEEYTDSIDPSKVRQAIRKGVQQAQDEIEEVTQAMDAFGWGEGEGTIGRGGSAKEKRELYQKVRDSKKLRELAELAGRMRFTAAQKQRSKADYARDEISDIVTGDDLARLLPSEMSKLGNPMLKKLFYKGLIEKSLLCYELKGNEPKNKGPIVVAIDNSGSMGGDRELWSKAVALGLLEIAVKQNRSFVLHHFNTRVQKSFRWEKGSAKPGIDTLLNVMDFFAGGGTRFQPVLEQALTDLEESDFNEADVIMITDGEADTDFAEEYKRRAADKEATTYGILIGYGEAALKAYCDETVAIQNVNSPNSATDMVFSI